MKNKCIRKNKLIIFKIIQKYINISNIYLIIWLLNNQNSNNNWLSDKRHSIVFDFFIVFDLFDFNRF